MTRLTVCLDTEYNTCKSLDLKVGKCASSYINPFLRGVSSVKLEPEQQCVFYYSDNCDGPNVIISQPEPSLDFLPNEHVEAHLNDNMRSVWCCQNSGKSGKCNGSCVCEKDGVGIGEAGN